MADSQSSLELLARGEHEKTRQAVKELRETQLQDKAYEQCRASLFYPTIHSRQEQIADSYQDTYEWIFEESNEIEPTRPWYKFKHWLEHGSEICWINAKAGSGKSTMMNSARKP